MRLIYSNIIISLLPSNPTNAFDFS